MICGVAEQAFGRRVAGRREELGLSRRRAAALSGVSETAWRNIEHGREVRRGVERPSPNPPQRITVRKIAGVLGWPVGDALRWAGYDDFFDDTEHVALSQSRDPWIELQRVWPSLSPQQQWSLVYVARAIQDPQAPIPSEPGDELLLLEVSPGAADRERRGLRRDDVRS